MKKHKYIVMKNKVLLIVWVLLPICSVKAQLPSVVTDVVSYTYYADMIFNGIEQFESIAKQTEMAKKALEKVEKVNSYVKKSRMAIAVGDNFVKMYEEARTTPKLIAKVRITALQVKYKERFVAIYEKAEILADIFSESLKAKKLEGDDFQRLDFLTKMYEQSEEVLKSMQSLNADIYFHT